MSQFEDLGRARKNNPEREAVTLNIIVDFESNKLSLDTAWYSSEFEPPAIQVGGTPAEWVKEHDRSSFWQEFEVSDAASVEIQIGQSGKYLWSRAGSRITTVVPAEETIKVLFT